jgi:protein TonB
VPPDARPRLTGWLALSALLHAAGFAAALAWSERQASVSIDPIPIAWVRVEPREEVAAPGPPGAPTPPPVAAAPVPPPSAPAPAPRREPKPPPRRRPAPPAPASEPAVAIRVPDEPVAPAVDVIEPPATPTAQAAVASGPGTNGAAPSGHAAGAYGAGGAGGNGANGGASGAGATAGLATGWMPAGGVQRAPLYPESARRRGVEGTAQVALRLAASGRVDDVRLHRTSGDAALDGAALASVRRWRFDPPPPGAEWRDLWFLVPIEFRLR